MSQSLIPEEPVFFDGTVYTARRNTGESRWQVFAEGEFSPVGYIELHRCERHADKERLLVFGPDGRQPSDCAPPMGCVGDYMSALNYIRMRGTE